jgi:methionyl-tRNA synthetase
MTSESKPAYDRWSLRDPSSLAYGYYAGSSNNSGVPNSEDDATAAAAITAAENKGFYITTAINYTNGPAHMGHAYEAATTDAIARFARLNAHSDGNSPQSAYFVTGADEHGEKIAKTAEREDKAPIDICNTYVTGFQCLNQRILVTNDDYIRTTSDRHKRTAQALWNMCAANDDIYLDQYQGWYNVKEETFVTDSEAEMCNFCDPSSGQPLQRVQEASYFFKMSQYHDRLVEHILSNPDFIRPEQHRNAILTRLHSDKLRDLSISRTTFTHGIPVPDGFESNHVMYVWFDALTNYLTGVDVLGVCDPDKGKNEELAKLWPADVHIIGKDILWFHTVIWPCILMSAGLPLPKSVFAHGFVNDKDGKKMSKSIGNVVDPHDMLDKFDVDSFRWYLCKEAPYGGELSFSEDNMRDMHNADLCDTLGNLVHRVTTLCGKYSEGLIPNVPGPEVAVLDFDAVRKAYVEKMEVFALEGGANIAMQACRDVNGYLTKEEPWKLKGDEFAEKRQIIVRATLEAVYAVAHLLLPFIPVGATEIFKKLNTPPRSFGEINSDLRNLVPKTKIDSGSILYERNFSEEEIKLSKEDASKNKKLAYEEAQRLKKEKKAKEAAASKASKNEADQSEFTKIDIRVGQITKVWCHPDADKLYCEEIDVGEDSSREIASGLKEHYALEEMQGRKVLVVCNLKAAKIVGFTSNGMVLAAKVSFIFQPYYFSNPELNISYTIFTLPHD